MKINYEKYLRKNLINCFIDILKNFELNGIQDGHHLYITFDTQNSKVKIPKFLKSKYSKEMTIVIQYEFWDLIIKKKFFSICLSFNGVKTNLEIPFDSIKSFADPYANFGLKLIDENIINEKTKKLIKKENKKTSNEKSNVIQFKKN
tara:strand:+ start:3895 stop:4335 length:441 start_codon:yes stop_codon:yes gene_type:complete